jgi:phytoene dehydrogenase-like protein
MLPLLSSFSFLFRMKDALVRAITKSSKGRILTSSHVESVEITDGRATAVTLRGGGRVQVFPLFPRLDDPACSRRRRSHGGSTQTSALFISLDFPFHSFTFKKRTEQVTVPRSHGFDPFDDFPVVTC